MSTEDSYVMDETEQRIFAEDMDTFFSMLFDQYKKNGSIPDEFPYLHLCSPETQQVHEERKKMAKKGVCPVCQQQDIDIRPAPIFSREWDNEDFFGNMLDDESDRWILENHDAYGQYCDGSGQCPQAVYEEKKAKVTA